MELRALVKVLIDDCRIDLTHAEAKLVGAGGQQQFFRGHAIQVFYANANAVGTPT